jgi:superfamily II RNA helicase
VRSNQLERDQAHPGAAVEHVRRRPGGQQRLHPGRVDPPVQEGQVTPALAEQGGSGELRRVGGDRDRCGHGSRGVGHAPRVPREEDRGRHDFALRPTTADPDAIYASFTGWAEDQGLTPYPAQADALLELVTGANVILATPTGSGKSLVATGLQYATLAEGGRVFYTAPIKALVSEKFFAAVAVFGPERVGMLTGDASVNPGAPVICCTAEVLANIALRQGSAADIAAVIMDEFHYYADPERGWAWQVPLIELPRASSC